MGDHICTFGISCELNIVGKFSKSNNLRIFKQPLNKINTHCSLLGAENYIQEIKFDDIKVAMTNITVNTTAVNSTNGTSLNGTNNSTNITSSNNTTSSSNHTSNQTSTHSISYLENYNFGLL